MMVRSLLLQVRCPSSLSPSSALSPADRSPAQRSARVVQFTTCAHCPCSALLFSYRPFQVSLWAMAVCAARLGASALAAHQVWVQTGHRNCSNSARLEIDRPDLTLPGLCICTWPRQIVVQLWMLTSYISDGFADVGTMLGNYERQISTTHHSTEHNVSDIRSIGSRLIGSNNAAHRPLMKLLSTRFVRARSSCTNTRITFALLILCAFIGCC